MKRLDGKVALVTGSSSGFGRGIAEAFAREGAKVVCSDLVQESDSKGFEENISTPTDEAIRNAGGKAIFVKCDVTKQSDVANLVRAGVEKFGRIDIFVNNAGIYRGGGLAHELTEKDLDICYAVNVKGTFFGAQEAVKQFLQQGDGGNIINIVSTAGLQGHPKQSVYNASKGAAANLTRCLAIEYGRNKIRVNGICPTYCKTALTRAFYDNKEFDDMFTKSIPLGRWGEVKDVENLAVFLASDESDYIHGDLIRIDGGETLCRYSV
ncbi:SDR family oxidoreductase [candidate division KSB1 bacterium]|nr:SDR family oxidoreductase [candidate division KSB1 bacterium]